MTGKLYEGGIAGCLGYLLKRVVLLGAKLVGFKGFCLFLATALLCLGRIGEDVWLTLAVTLVCSASGIRVLDSLREGADALDAKNALSVRLAGRAGRTGISGGEYEGFWKNDSGGVAGGHAFALPSPGGGNGKAAAAGSGDEASSGGGQASEAARRAAGRRAGKAARKATGGLGERGRERIREVLEEAARCIE